MTNNCNTSVNHGRCIKISRHKIQHATLTTSMNSFSLLGRCRKLDGRMKDIVVPQTIDGSQIISIHNDNPDIKCTVCIGCNQIPCTSFSSQTVQILIIGTHSSSQKLHELRRGRGEKRHTVRRVRSEYTKHDPYDSTLKCNDNNVPEMRHGRFATVRTCVCLVSVCHVKH